MNEPENSLEARLERLDQEPPLELRRMTVLVCPPTSFWRCWCALYLPAALRRWLRLESDYMRETRDAAPLWQYWRGTGRPARRLLRRIGATPLRLVRNARWRDLQSAVRNGSQVIVLVAHHIDRPDAIEFAGETRPWNEIETVIGEMNGGYFLMIVCRSGVWRNELRDRFPRIVPAGGPAQMDLHQGLRFLGFFVGACDGSAPFRRAWAHAETRYFANREQHV